MSRRVPNPAADRAAQNQQTIKTLLKLEGNKTCADCKRNKHPRWASWNLGVFVCIRCSGIHRGMGTHISRVKSVDLDAWTDEQLQSVLRWGNTRANKYWEAKLAPGHVPSEAKIENFIRTKYDSKRWTMEGPIPDPATLDDEGDDNVPLNVVQEKAKLERSSPQRASVAPHQSAGSTQQTGSSSDLFGDVSSPPPRPSTTDTPGVQSLPSKATTPSKQPEPSNSLFGLDFFGGSSSAGSGVSSSVTSTAAGSAGSSRPDLKQSILSLYASAPRPQNQAHHEGQSTFGSIGLPPNQLPPAQQRSSAGGMDDAFSGLNLNSTNSPAPSKSQQQPKPNPFASLGQSANQRSAVASPQTTLPSASGGGFFDPSPKAAPKLASTSKPPVSVLQKPQTDITSLGFGDLNLPSSNAPASQLDLASGPNANNLFGFSGPAPKGGAATAPDTVSSGMKSAFNLSAPAPELHAPLKPSSSVPPGSNDFSNFGADPWGSNNAWANPEPSPATTTKAKPADNPSTSTAIPEFSSWGGVSSSTLGFGGGGGKASNQAPPKIALDEDFGGWNSAAPTKPITGKPGAAPPNGKPAGNYSGSDDLFSNVWE